MKRFKLLREWNIVTFMLSMWLLLLVLSSCSQDSTEAWKPVCRHDAVYAALTVGEEYPTRIVVGVNSSSGIRHAQAQAFIRDQWRWLAVSNGYIVIEESMRPDFVPDGYRDPAGYASTMPRVKM